MIQKKKKESLGLTSPKIFSSYPLVSCSEMSKPHLFLRLFLRFCLFFSCLSSFARSSSESSSHSCSSRLIPCTFSTAICQEKTEWVFSFIQYIRLPCTYYTYCPFNFRNPCSVSYKPQPDIIWVPNHLQHSSNTGTVMYGVDSCQCHRACMQPYLHIPQSFCVARQYRGRRGSAMSAPQLAASARSGVAAHTGGSPDRSRPPLVLCRSSWHASLCVCAKS